MKKLLSLLAATGLVATSGSVAVACNKKTDEATGKDLSTLGADDLKLQVSDAKKETAVAAVVVQIKAKLKVDAVLDTDFTVGDADFTAPKSDAVGKIKVTAKSGSKLLNEGKSAEFSLTLKAAESTAKDLATITGDKLNVVSDDATQEKAESVVLAQIKTQLGVEVAKTTDVTFSGFKAPSESKTGTIIATAVSTSNLVKGSATFTLTLKFDEASTPQDLSTITGDDLKLDPEGDTKEYAIKQAVLLIQNKLKVTAVLDKDFTVADSDFTAATKDTVGSIKLSSKEGSTKLVAGKSVTFSLVYRNNVDLKLVQDFINGEGDYATFNPALYTGGVTVSPTIITDKDAVHNQVKAFTGKLLVMAAFIGIDFTLDQLLETVDVTYYDDAAGTVEHTSNKIQSLKIVVKDNNERHLQGFYLHGEIKTKIFEQINITTIVKEDSPITLECKKSGELDALQAYLKNKYSSFLTEHKATANIFGSDSLNDSLKYKDGGSATAGGSAEVTLPNPNGDYNLNNLFYKSVTLKLTITIKSASE
ncbi:hypothetical protein SHELI_v1c09960 [Spiroplasma helicoides]|uniref:Uncharacterized protein n=1 Tax=Spiroplasma helicoides TaxID=216938 RepID=A0A1B3SLZ4_9MOLU|nr:lipoprotein [Spiroplasma helicoides]AOG60943.1 hypothetical protein SHELI_v1c09960 [Spiroplasma helicoides]